MTDKSVQHAILTAKRFSRRKFADGGTPLVIDPVTGLPIVPNGGGDGTGQSSGTSVPSSSLSPSTSTSPTGFGPVDNALANPGATATNIGAGLALGALGPVGMGLSAVNSVSGLLGGPTIGSSLFGTNAAPTTSTPAPSAPAPTASPAPANTTSAPSSGRGISDALGLQMQDTEANLSQTLDSVQAGINDAQTAMQAPTTSGLMNGVNFGDLQSQVNSAPQAAVMSNPSDQPGSTPSSSSSPTSSQSSSVASAGPSLGISGLDQSGANAAAAAIGPSATGTFGLSGPTGTNAASISSEGLNASLNGPATPAAPEDVSSGVQGPAAPVANMSSPVSSYGNFGDPTFGTTSHGDPLSEAQAVGQNTALANMQNQLSDPNINNPDNVQNSIAQSLPSNSPLAANPLSNPTDPNAPPEDAPPEDTPPADTPPADSPPASAPTDSPPTDSPPADSPPADSPPADSPPSDGQSGDQGGGDQGGGDDGDGHYGGRFTDPNRRPKAFRVKHNWNKHIQMMSQDDLKKEIRKALMVAKRGK